MSVMLNRQGEEGVGGKEKGMGEEGVREEGVRGGGCEREVRGGGREGRRV